MRSFRCGGGPGIGSQQLGELTSAAVQAGLDRADGRPGLPGDVLDAQVRQVVQGHGFAQWGGQRFQGGHHRDMVFRRRRGRGRDPGPGQRPAASRGVPPSRHREVARHDVDPRPPGCPGTRPRPSEPRPARTPPGCIPVPRRGHRSRRTERAGPAGRWRRRTRRTAPRHPWRRPRANVGSASTAHPMPIPRPWKPPLQQGRTPTRPRPRGRPPGPTGVLFLPRPRVASGCRLVPAWRAQHRLQLPRHCSVRSG